MRMTRNQLFADTVSNAGEIKATLFLFHLRVEHHLQKHVSELFFQKLRVVKVNGLNGLISLLNKILAYALVRLLLVPWATIRRTKHTHDPQKVINRIFGLPPKFHIPRPSTNTT